MEAELLSRGIAYHHSRPYHPQTCGKVERFHQTPKGYLSKQEAACRPLSTEMGNRGRAGRPGPDLVRSPGGGKGKTRVPQGGVSRFRQDLGFAGTRDAPVAVSNRI